MRRPSGIRFRDLIFGGRFIFNEVLFLYVNFSFSCGSPIVLPAYSAISNVTLWVLKYSI